jgi:hypothetical protein
MRHVYICEKCGRESQNAEKAEDCEKTHRDIVPVKMRFSSFGEYGPLINIPKKVFIKFSDDSGDFGYFELVQYGPKGL